MFHQPAKQAAASLLVATLLTAAIPPANTTSEGRADEVSQAKRAISLIQSATDVVIDGADVTVAKNQQIAVETTNGTDLRFPATASDQIHVRPSGGEAFSLTIPGDAPAHVVSIGGSSAVVYPGADGSSSTAIANTHGAVQVLTTLADPSSPSTSSYEFATPEGTELRLDSDTGAVVALNAGRVVFGIAPPWAVDAAGTQVPTRFVVSGTTVTQVIEHAAGDYVYPIVADPKVNSSMIDSYKWVKGSKGYTISVSVTPWMGWVTITAAAADGWSELTRAVKSNSATEYKRLNTKAMRQQWNCHAAGKAVIGIAGWLGIDGRPTWDLETWRKPTANPADMVAKLCNW